MLAYAAGMLFLLWLPTLSWGKGAAVLILGTYGAILSRNTRSWWCPHCWFEARGGRHGHSGT